MGDIDAKKMEHRSGAVIGWRAMFSLPSVTAGLSLFVLMAITFVDVVLRSTMSAPIEAATELTRLLMAVVVFASLPAVTIRGEHVVVDLADSLFRGPSRRRARRRGSPGSRR